MEEEEEKVTMMTRKEKFSDLAESHHIGMLQEL